MNNQNKNLEEDTIRMEKESQKLKDLLENKRLNSASKSNRWSASSKKPLSIVDNKCVVDNKPPKKDVIRKNIVRIKPDKENDVQLHYNQL